MNIARWVRIFLALGAIPAAAYAAELQVMGRASIPVANRDPQEIRHTAAVQAKRAAVVSAIEKVLGPNANRDPRVASKIEAVAGQIPEERIVDLKASAGAGTYDVALTLVLDDKEFRTLLSDQGIAVNTATARASSILAVMDEFFTTPRDLKVPLDEFVEFRSEVGRHMAERAKVMAATATTSAELRQEGEDRAASAGRQVEAVKGSYLAAAEEHDNQYYRKLVRYQPQNTGPEKTSQTYNALMGQLQDYDLRVLDNDLLRSKFFHDRPLTIEQLQNGAALSKYVAFARSEAHADFFMIGNAIVVDAGKNDSTGDAECTAMVTVKTYSTLDGESIASETFAEASAGRNLNDCVANVSKKVAAIGGPILGARIQEYWKRRSAYGREYVLALTGTNLPLMVRAAFAKAVKALPGIENDTQRGSSDRRLEVVVTYKGSDPIDQALAAALSGNAAFASLDAKTDGNQVLFCMGPCSQPVKPVSFKKGKKK